MRNPRIEIATLKHKISKTVNEQGKTFLSATKNYAGDEPLPFTVCCTDQSTVDGIEVTSCLSAHATWKEAVTALLDVAASLPADDQKQAHQSIIDQAKAAEATEVRIRKELAWIKRKLEIAEERERKRLLGYID
jgi:hypothetical protein